MNKSKIILPLTKWSNFWTNLMCQIGGPYNSERIDKILREKYSIVSWQADSDKDEINIFYTDKMLITIFILECS